VNAHDVLKSVFRRQLETDAVTTRELQWCAGAARVIDRANGMYDVLPVAMVAGRHVSGLFAATMIGIFVAFFRQPWEGSQYSRWEVVARGHAGFACRAAT